MTPARRARAAAAHVRTMAAMERGLASDIRRIFARIARAAADDVLAGNALHAPNAAQEFHDALYLALERRMLAAARIFARMTYADLTGSAKNWSPVEETKFIDLLAIVEKTIHRWLVDYGARKVRAITETTRKLIRRALVKGNEEKEPPRVLAKRIRSEVGGEIGRARAQTIARTEIGVASSVGSDEAAKVTGLQLDKVWVATEDARTRPDHRKADGQKVDMDRTFTVGGEAMRYPRDPDGSAGNVVNCRCVCTYEPRLPA